MVWTCAEEGFRKAVSKLSSVFNMILTPVLLQAIAEICHNGYMDALRFLQENSEEVLFVSL